MSIKLRLFKGIASIIYSSTKIHLKPPGYISKDDTKAGRLRIRKSGTDYAADTYRDISTLIMEIPFSIVSNHMNLVMKVQTIIASIFMPLSFLAGVYGMIFDTELPGNMPVLSQPYGYVVFLAICLVVGISLLIFFRPQKMVVVLWFFQSYELFPSHLINSGISEKDFPVGREI